MLWLATGYCLGAGLMNLVLMDGYRAGRLRGYNVLISMVLWPIVALLSLLALAFACVFVAADEIVNKGAFAKFGLAGKPPDVRPSNPCEKG